MRVVATFSLLALGLVTARAKFPENFDARLDRVALGSCNRSDLPQPLWPVIAARQPDLWIWMGDNIYGDSPNLEVLRAKYERQFNQPAYAAFRAQTPIIGTWDDHDYGKNNAGAEYSSKVGSRDLALEFMEVPPEDPRWSREGIYGAYTFGPAGQRVKIYLLDDRYFATPPKQEDSDLLGEAQWQWLQDELRASDAQVNLIVSGIQILPEDHRYEKWANFPRSRQALLDFLRKEEIPGVIFASGDRHIHELSLKSDADTAYPLLEITTSGLTHSWGPRFPGEKNRYRTGPVHPGKGFGQLTFDWDANPVTVTAQVFDEKGEEMLKWGNFPLKDEPWAWPGQ